MPEPLPDDWRTRFVDMVRGAAPLDGTWFTGGPALGPLEQIAVYREQYRLRLVDALREETPGTAHLLGEEAAATYERYLEDHPSSTWTLNRIAVAFADWLEEDGADDVVVDMARLDRAVQAGFEAGAGTPLRPDQLLTVPRLALQPHVTLLRLRYNVHLVRSAVLGRGEAPEVVAAAVPLVVFRRGIKMRHWAIGLAPWTLLRALDGGATVEEAIERAFAQATLDITALPEALQAWFRDFAERDLVRAVSPG